MEIIKYSLFGLQLREPMALITNGMIALFSFWAYASLRKDTSVSPYWKQFYLVLGISMVFGALGHTFFDYFHFVGKIPSWSLGAATNILIAICILQYDQRIDSSNPWVIFAVAKSIILLGLSVYTLKFVFVAIDTIISYLLFTGYYAYRLKNKGLKEMKYMLIGVGVLLPSAFIFLLKLNVSRWLNKDDLSHVLMLGGIICFYIGAKRVQIDELSEEYV